MNKKPPASPRFFIAAKCVKNQNHPPLYTMNNLSGTPLSRNKDSVGPYHTPWKDGTVLIKKMIEKYARKLRKEEGVEQLTVFIDTNPAFSVHFQLLLASTGAL